MGNLTKKTITRGAVVALALSAGAATTANAAVTRVSGSDRYATATQVAGLWPTSTTAILAAGEGHDVDALTVAPLAKQKNAPIILVNASAAPATIVAQFAKYDTVYIANGTGVISDAVQTALTAAGKKVTRLGGATRYATALNIAKAFGTATDIVIANGDDDHLVDSLSIAAIAAAKGMPIFLTSANSLDSAEATYAKGLTATNAYVLGGTGVVSDSVATGLGKVTRLSGAGRYETNAAVVTAFKSDAAMDMSNVYIASGEDANLIDSLVAAPLAGLKKAPIVFAHNNINSSVNTLLGGIINSKTNITVLGGTGAVSTAASDAVAKIQDPNYVGANTGVLAVSSVAATSSTTIKVTFSQAPKDTSKVTFTVSQGSVAVPTTTTWNSANTEATLTNAANFVTGDYTVNVKNDTTDLGTSNLTIAEQKIAKLEITSTKLGVTNVTTGYGIGYATYKVLDQFGNDITTQPISNSLTFQTGVGSADGKNGVIKVTPNVNLITFTSGVTITGYDSSSGVSASATLAVSTQVGTLSDISISAITNADKKVLTAEDSTSLFYLTYVATDLSGNPTTDYDTVRNGLILTGDDQLTGTSSYITAKVVKDPADSKKAAIQVQVKDQTSISADMPLVLTAMTYTGKTSTLNVTLKKAAKVDKITLMAPSYNIAIGEDKEIPFVAYDQNGGVLTKYSDIVDVTNAIVSVSGAHWYKNVDGTASLKAGNGTDVGFASDGQQVITATTATGKYSSININIQKKVMADKLEINTAIMTSIMQEKQVPGAAGTWTTTTGTAIQKIDFGQDKGGLTVKDQYGRVIDMTTATGNTNANASKYYVKAVSTNPDVIALNMTGPNNEATTGKLSLGTSQLVVTAGIAGTATVTFSLYSDDPKKSDGTTSRDTTAIVDTVSQTFTVLANKDIKDYTIDTLANPIYCDVASGYNQSDIAAALAATTTPGAIAAKTAVNTSGSLTARQKDYKFNPKVYGKTSSGSKVVLANNSIMGATVDSSDFLVFNIAGLGADKYDSVKVAAKQFSDSAKTGSTANLQVTILGADGDIHSVSTPIKSSTTDPVAASVAVEVANDVTGVSMSGDTVTLKGGSDTASYYPMLTQTRNSTQTKYGFAKYDGLGNDLTPSIFIKAKDQYGRESMQLSNFYVVASGTSLHGHAFTIDKDGSILTNQAAYGDDVVISGVINGFVKTVKISFR